MTRTKIVSQRFAEGVEEHGIEEQIPNEIDLQDWDEFSPNSISADHLVLDLNFTHVMDGVDFSDLPVNDLFRGRNKKIGQIEHDEENLTNIFDDLTHTNIIPNFLTPGGSLTVLYSDLLAIESESGKIQTLSWLYRHGLLSRTKPIMEARMSDSGIGNYEVMSESETVEDYFAYVDGYTHTLDFEGSEADGHYEFVGGDPEILAKSQEGGIIAARLHNFADASGEIREAEGNITFLPQPTRLNPRLQNLVMSLSSIVFEEQDSERSGPTAYGLPDGSSDLPDIVTDDVRRNLGNSKYGEEVLKHIEDGDACVENNLWQPALGSYIHAIEWAFIAFLEDSQGLDVINDEQQGGTYYNLAGGHHSLLDEVTNHVSLGQKTVSSIRSMDQAQRRWMAHHKSGRTLGHDVMSLRSRLETILIELFS